MKKNYMRQMVITMMAAVLAMNTAPMVKAVSLEKDETANQDRPVLIPQPGNVEYKDGEVTLTDRVNIDGDAADPVALEALLAFLEANGIDVNEETQEDDTTIVLAEAVDNSAAIASFEDTLGLDCAADLKDEGYVLTVDKSVSEAGTILIEGKDGDGTFYGVQTLEQLAKTDSDTTTVKEVNIVDQPTMTTRGIIEGFYGNPWTHQDRMEQLKFYGSMKMNTYIYAPKDDQYHREKWREPYPENEMTRMNELIEEANANKVDFVFALSPGIDVRFDGEAGESDFQALMSKCESLYAMGVRNFAIFFDDISNKDGVKQATFLNRFNTEFIQAKGDIKPLMTVPTEYDSIAMTGGINGYTKNFSETLDPSIKVLWTGSAVVPEGIDAANANYVKSIYGDRLGIWWNYPVTDYIQDKLALGPVYNVNKDLEGVVDFFTMNPMEHAELSEISLSTGADYAWNTSAYDYQSSFENAIDTLYGDLAPYMFTFANHSTRLEAGWASTGRGDAPEIREMMYNLIRKIAKGQDAAAEIEGLDQEFDRMIESADALKAAFTPEQLKHCEGNLNKLKALGENDKIALQLFLARNNNDPAAAGLEATLRKNLTSLQNGKKVSEKTALAFITDVLNYDPNPTAGFHASSTFVAPGEEIQFFNDSSVSSVDFKWVLKGSSQEISTDENPVVTYAKAGVYPVKLTAKNKLGESVALKEGFITITEEATGNITNLSKDKKATASGYTSASEAPVKAIDGNSSTKWCATGNGPHTLTIDLGKPSTISNVIISHAEIGGEGSALNTRDYRIQVSNDGTNFTDVLAVKGNIKGLTNDAIPVSVAQYVRLVVSKATQGNDKAARIYEVEVMGLDKEITIPPVYVEDTTLTKAILKAAIDKTEAAIANTNMDTLAPSVADLIRVRFADAKAIYEDPKADNEATMQAWLNLADALHYLDFKADKTLLNTLITTAKEINTDEYVSGVEAFKDALKIAEEVYGDNNALQDRIDTAYGNLTVAMAGLSKGEPGDSTTLRTMVDMMKARVGDGSAYRHDQAWNAYVDALANAEAVIVNTSATQAEIDAAWKTLAATYEDLRLMPDESLLNDLRDYLTMVESLDLGLFSQDHTVYIMSVRDDATSALENIDQISDEALADIHANVMKAKGIIEKVENVETPTRPEDDKKVEIPAEIKQAVEQVKATTTAKGTTKTGDTTRAAAMVGMLAASGAGLMAVLRRRKKNK